MAEMGQMLDARDVQFVEVGGETDEGDSRRPMVKCCRSRSFSPPALLLLVTAFTGLLCIVLKRGPAMSFEAPETVGTTEAEGHYRASELIFVDPTELEARENRLKCHLDPKTYSPSLGSLVWPPVMVVSSTDGTVEAMFQPDNLESEAMHHLQYLHFSPSREALLKAMSQPDSLSRFRPLYGSSNKFLLDLDEKLDLKGHDSSWARAAWITGRNTSVRDILTILGGCDTSAIPAQKLIMMGGLKFFDPDVRLPMPFGNNQKPGFENNTAEMRPRFKAIQGYLRCHVHKTKCTACCTSLPLSLCDTNALFECTTAVVTIADKLRMLQAWMGAKSLPRDWSAEWLLDHLGNGRASWLDGLLPPSFSYSSKVPRFMDQTG